MNLNTLKYLLAGNKAIDFNSKNNRTTNNKSSGVSVLWDKLKTKI